jgi:trehalose 6-phosphate phosphatase
MLRTPPNSDDLAIFLDLDGTLLEIVEQPDKVDVPEWLGDLLKSTASRLGGALALLSGRSIAELDRILGTADLPAAGIHGLELRGTDGVTHRTESAPVPDAVRRRLSEFARRHAGILVEDKTHSIAVHFRQAPDKASVVHDELASIAGKLGDAFKLQSGKMVLELRPDGVDKGTALANFMARPPFKGRVPIFIGDDVTDEDGFEVINELGGYSVRVGQAVQDSHARYTLRNVDAVHDWLDRLDCKMLLAQE